MNVKRTVKNSMTLAHTIAVIVKNTELTEQEIMMLSLDEIIELRELISAKLRTAFELERKIKCLQMQMSIKKEK